MALPLSPPTCDYCGGPKLRRIEPYCDTCKRDGVPLTPRLAQHEGSWIVVKKGTLDAVLETFEKKTADAINRKKYDVLTVGDYLGRMNLALKAAKACRTRKE